MNESVPYRKRPTRFTRFAVAGLILFLLTGCAGTGLFAADLPDDGPPPAASAPAARRFVEKAVAAAEDVGTAGRFTLTLTEEEVTSFLSIGVVLLRRLQTVSPGDSGQLQDMPGLEGIEELGKWRELLNRRDSLPDLGGRPRLGVAIEEPAVTFRGSGEIVVRGFLKLLVVRVPARVVTAPRASEGELVLDFVEGQLGPLPMPEVVFDYLGGQLSRALLAGKEYGEITEIRVADGVITISGRRSGQ